MVIARHQPRNPVAWVLLGFVLLAMLSTDAGYYAVYSALPARPARRLGPA